MSRHPNLIPSKGIETALPLPLFARLTSYLYSELESRVPHGAYSRFFTQRTEEFFQHSYLDLGPYLGSAPGAFLISGTPATLDALASHLKELS